MRRNIGKSSVSFLLVLCALLLGSRPVLRTRHRSSRLMRLTRGQVRTRVRLSRESMMEAGSRDIILMLTKVLNLFRMSRVCSQPRRHFCHFRWPG